MKMLILATVMGAAALLNPASADAQMLRWSGSTPSYSKSYNVIHSSPYGSYGYHGYFDPSSHYNSGRDRYSRSSYSNSYKYGSRSQRSRSNRSRYNHNDRWDRNRGYYGSSNGSYMHGYSSYGNYGGWSY